MPTTYPLCAAVEYGPLNAGIEESIAYKVVDINGIQLVAPSNEGVRESDVPGNYYVRGGIEVDIDAKGRVLWSNDAGASWNREDPFDLAIIREQIDDLLTEAAEDDGVSPGGM